MSAFEERVPELESLWEINMQCWYISWGFVNHDIMGGGNMGKAQRAKAHEAGDLGASLN